jgi:hypothetical protein
MARFLDLDTEARARMLARRNDADASRLARLAKPTCPPGRPSRDGPLWRARRSVGFGLVRAGLRLTGTGSA